MFQHGTDTFEGNLEIGTHGRNNLCYLAFKKIERSHESVLEIWSDPVFKIWLDPDLV